MAKIGPIYGFFKEYRWLSNFHLQELTYDGDVFPTSEHAYQAMKALHDEDRERIRLAASPKEARQLGRKIEVRPDWDSIKYAVMDGVLRQKFRPGSELTQKLMDTYPRQLVEDNWWGDRYWGVCEGVGENNLGKILMTIRRERRIEANLEVTDDYHSEESS